MKCVCLLVVLFTALSVCKGKIRKSKSMKSSLNNKKFNEVEVEAVLRGYKEAYDLCHENFKMERWNCPKPDEVKETKKPISLTEIYKEATKETSYIYSIVAAGIAHNMIRACQLGKEEMCSCKKDDNPRSGMGSTLVTCSQNFEYGFKRARRMLRNLDFKPVQNSVRKYFNWNNAAAGFKIYQASLQKECRCHGVSGHCSRKLCWNSAPPSLKGPSIKLKELYNKAVKLQESVIGGRTRPRPPRTASVANDTKLVYINESPNYCQENRDQGIFGTLGRECDTKNKKSCTNLCSNCGYRIHSYMDHFENKKCKCKFHWCCKVTCETCIDRKVVSKCLKKT